MNLKGFWPETSYHIVKYLVLEVTFLSLWETLIFTLLVFMICGVSCFCGNFHELRKLGCYQCKYGFLYPFKIFKFLHEGFKPYFTHYKFAFKLSLRVALCNNLILYSAWMKEKDSFSYQLSFLLCIWFSLF